MYRINKSLKEFNNEILRENTIKDKDIYNLCNRKCKVVFVELTIMYEHETYPRSIIFLDVDGKLKGFRVPLQMFFRRYKHKLDEFIDEINVDKGYVYLKNRDRNKHDYMEEYYGDINTKTNDNANDKYNNTLDGQVSMFDFI